MHYPEWVFRIQTYIEQEQPGWQWCETLEEVGGWVKLAHGPAIPALLGSPHLAFEVAQPDRLVVIFGDDDIRLHYPIPPTEKALHHVWDDYIAPAMTLKPLFPLNVERLAKIRFLRETPEPVVTQEQRRWRVYLGLIDEDGIVGIENGAVFNPFVYSDAVTMATASGGNFSQYWSAYSKTLISFEFSPNFAPSEQFLCYLQIDYLSRKHTAWMRHFRERNGNVVVQLLPDDIPLDIAGAIAAYDFNFAISEAQLMEYVIDGDFNALLILTTLTLDDRFEEVFLPLAEHSNMQFRTFVAREALFRKNREVMEHALIHIEDRGLRKELKAALM